MKEISKNKVKLLIVSILVATNLFTFLIVRAIFIHNEKVNYFAQEILKIEYQAQNGAFTLPTVLQCYVPYSVIDESLLQKNLDNYKVKTGKVLTKDDVKAFLADNKLPNGQPKTYENAGNKEIKDYVDYFGTVEHYMV